MKRNLFHERGQVMVLIALAAVGIIAMVGLAIDGSAKFSDQRHAQNAADTAALAGALEIVKYGLGSNGTGWKIAAQDIALENGYELLTTRSVVEVYLCSESGSDCGTYAGDSDYVQVKITSTIDTTFARVVGIRQLTNHVQAVALAKTGGDLFDGASFVAVNPSPSCSSGGGSGGGSFDVGGSGAISLNGGGIFVNSDEACGYSQTSCNASLTITGGAGINSAGSNINQAGCGTPVPEDTTKEQVSVPDEIYMPPEPSECSQSPNHPAPTQLGATSWRLYPGVYTDSSFPPTALIGVNQTIELASGIYCIDRSGSNSDVTWNGNKFASFTGTGVMFYIKGGVGFNININSPITLSAPQFASTDSRSEYNGYLIIVDGNYNSHPSCTINGGSFLTLDGTIFAPYCDVTINGDNNSNSTYNVQVIGWNVKLNGNNVITFNYNPGTKAKTRNKVGLMR